jgi:hypothetical protein
MTDTEQDRWGDDEEVADLCSRLDAIVTEEDKFHPVGCSSWWEEARVAVDMAKDVIRRAAQSAPEQVGIANGDEPKAHQHPATTSDDLVGRLTRMIAPTGFGSTRSYLANPDGPEAAARISALERQVGVMREALRFYADDHEFPSDGPWGVNSDDFGNVARQALATQAESGDQP